MDVVVTTQCDQAYLYVPVVPMIGSPILDCFELLNLSSRQSGFRDFDADLSHRMDATTRCDQIFLHLLAIAMPGSPILHFFELLNLPPRISIPCSHHMLYYSTFCKPARKSKVKKSSCKKGRDSDDSWNE
jgi:hypothetical protein